MDVGSVKDLMIIIDFIISCVAGCLQVLKYNEVSDILFKISGVFLAVAVVCIIIEKIRK